MDEFKAAGWGIGVMGCLTILITIGSLVALALLVAYLIANPQAIGEFFGRIVSGFNSIK
jgi:hypothetical protein